MSVTYPHDRPVLQTDHIDAAPEEPFVPVYARNRRNTRSRKGGIKTWMILGPVGVLVLVGGAAAMMMGGDGGEATSAPLAEPAATAPVLPAQPLPVENASIEIAPVVEATPAPAPVVRRAAPAPARRTAAPAPARAATPAPATTPRAEAAPTGPQPYTATLNTAPSPAATPAPASPAPVIVIQPAD